MSIFEEIEASRKGRQFTLLVRDKKARLLAYPQAGFTATLKAMETLAGRGFEVKARTTANGITEILTLEEMKEAQL